MLEADVPRHVRARRPRLAAVGARAHLVRVEVLAGGSHGVEPDGGGDEHAAAGANCIKIGLPGKWC